MRLRIDVFREETEQGDAEREIRRKIKICLDRLESDTERGELIFIRMPPQAFFESVRIPREVIMIAGWYAMRLVELATYVDDQWNMFQTEPNRMFEERCFNACCFVLVAESRGQYSAQMSDDENADRVFRIVALFSRWLFSCGTADLESIKAFHDRTRRSFEQTLGLRHAPFARTAGDERVRNIFLESALVQNGLQDRAF